MSFLYYLGGKGKLLEFLLTNFPKKIEGYIEPFVGSGVVWEAVDEEYQLKTSAILNDKNKQLMNVYRCLKKNPQAIVRTLKRWEAEHSKDFYYLQRNRDRELDTFDNFSEYWKASRYIYLNRASFRGLWRENKKGQMNAPFGDRSVESLFKYDAILSYSQRLNRNNTYLFARDYKEILKRSIAGDFIYLDPPYLLETGFTAYTDGQLDLTSWYERLVEELKKLDERGIKWALSNDGNEKTFKLFKEYNIKQKKIERSIGKGLTKKESNQEILIMNY